MNKKLLIGFILIIILLIIGTCVFNIEEKPAAIITKKQATKSLRFFNEPVILIIDKNWDKKVKDSLINTKLPIPIEISTSESFVFISQSKDTIQYNLSQINSLNPIIFFHPNEGPFLTTLNKFNRVFNFYFDPLIISEQDSLIIDSEDSIKTIPIEKPKYIHPIIKIDFLAPNLLIPHLKPELSQRQIPKKDTLFLTDRGLYYPLLNYNQFLSIRFDNDFWDYTDYYYTNGVAIGYSHPVFASSPISRLLISNANSGSDYYGLQIVQHMYSGLRPKVDSIVIGDRPWSAYSTIGQYLISLDLINKIRHYSEFNIGLLGPESGGGFLQNFVHVLLPNNSPPQGWENQIATDIIIDYKYRINKQFYSTKKFESYLLASVQAGTLRDNLGWGFGFRYGKFIPFYQDISISKTDKENTHSKRKIKYNLVFNIETKFIAYDATLQGGMINKESIYVLPAGAINRFIMETYIGGEISYGAWELQFLQFWKSREFQTGQDHKYASVRLNIAF